MDVQLIAMTAATILSGIHGNSGNHTLEQIQKAVGMAAQIIAEAETLVKNPPAA